MSKRHEILGASANNCRLDDTMGRIAIDVVLLPSEEVADRVIEANSLLIAEQAEGIVLNNRDCLPHISLAMGVIEETDLGEIETVLKEIADEFMFEPLLIIGVFISTNSRGEKVSSFVIDKTQELQSLHEEVLGMLGTFLGSDVTADMVAGEEVGDSTLDWIRNYQEKSSYANFQPHITIGYGQAKALDAPIPLAVSKLACCRLGNHCTCREVLVSVDL